MATQMLKLEPQSAILEEALGARLIDGKREPCEVSCADFDDALFKLVVLPGQESVLPLHAKLPCYDTLLEQGRRAMFGNDLCRSGDATRTRV